MDLEKCSKCGSNSFKRRYYFEKYDAKYLKGQYYKQYVCFICDNCGEPLVGMTADKILSGSGGF